jgi:hypothetical protein
MYLYIGEYSSLVINTVARLLYIIDTFLCVSLNNNNNIEWIECVEHDDRHLHQTWIYKQNAKFKKVVIYLIFVILYLEKNIKKCFLG